MKAIILGGGIGGVTTALALLDHGLEVELYEQASELGEIGAGLQIAANAAHVLKGLGLGGELDRVGVKAGWIDMRDLRSDRRLYQVELGERATTHYGEPFYQVHRPDLLDMLVKAVPDGVMRLNERALGFSQDESGVAVRFESGHEARGDLLIGADGIHSTVRSQLLGEEELEFSKIVAWRSLIPAERARPIGLTPDCHVWWGPNRSAVVYYVRGMELVNFVGIVPSEEAYDESWHQRGTVEGVRRSFQGSTPRLKALVDLIDEPFITGYYFRYPLSRWSEGRVTILGDAAHPMHPFLAQGACQAIEDAGVLGNVLGAASGDEIEVALKEFETRRLGRTSRVQTVARNAERMWHMSDPREIAERNKVLQSTMEIDPEAETVWGWLFNYDADSESEKPLKAPGSNMQRPESLQAWQMWAGMVTPQDVDRGHHGIREAYDRFLLENFPPPDNTEVTLIEFGDLKCQRVRSTPDEDGPVLLHFHGGGYVVGSIDGATNLAARLSADTRGTCITVGYRKAPEHPFPSALEDGVAVYRRLLDDGVDPSRLVLTGESAGGALAVAVALRIRDLALPLPAAIVAICPMADLAVTGDSVDATAGEDPICTRTFLTQMAASYLQGHDPQDPLASPIYANLEGLPPLLVQAARNEALYDDAARLVEAALRDGVDAELDVYEDTIHVFPVFEFLPEATSALQRIHSFVARTTGE